MTEGPAPARADTRARVEQAALDLFTAVEANDYRVVAEHVAHRTGTSPAALVPRLVAVSTRAAATTAFELWLADEGVPLATRLRESFAQLTGGFPALGP